VRGSKTVRVMAASGVSVIRASHGRDRTSVSESTERLPQAPCGAAQVRTRTILRPHAGTGARTCPVRVGRLPSPGRAGDDPSGSKTSAKRVCSEASGARSSGAWAIRADDAGNRAALEDVHHARHMLIRSPR
jgi:hypothetical protein